jgi:hypothetical protein
MFYVFFEPISASLRHKMTITRADLAVVRLWTGFDNLDGGPADLECPVAHAVVNQHTILRIML